MKSMNKHQWIIFGFGVVIFVIFLATGQYLERVFRPSHIDDISLRMGARASHIYILLISQAILTSSFIKMDYKEILINVIANGGRYVLVGSGLIFVISFVVDHSASMERRGMVLAGCISALVGISMISSSIFSKERIKV